MTVMFERFFGVPQSVIRLGKLKELSGTAVKVYIALMHESERYRTRELTLTVAQLKELVGGSSNSHATARAQLVKAGLVQAESYGAEGFIFNLCNPDTGLPFPLHPREEIRYQKKKVPLPVVAQEAPYHAKLRKPPKFDRAGTSFDFGANVRDTAGSGQQASPTAPSDVESRYQFDFSALKK
jgi:hypothetical protein